MQDGGWISWIALKICCSVSKQARAGYHSYLMAWFWVLMSPRGCLGEILDDLPAARFRCPPLKAGSRHLLKLPQRWFTTEIWSDVGALKIDTALSWRQNVSLSCVGVGSHLKRLDPRHDQTSQPRMLLSKRCSIPWANKVPWQLPLRATQQQPCASYSQ